MSEGPDLMVRMMKRSMVDMRAPGSSFLIMWREGRED